MKKSTRNGIIATVAVVCAGVAGFAIAGGFNEKEAVRDYLSEDTSYTQQVEKVTYSMSTNVQGHSYELEDPYIMGDTYYFILETPEDIVITGEDTFSTTNTFKFSYFSVNVGELSLVDSVNKTFQLKVQKKDVPNLKVVAIFEKETETPGVSEF